MKTFEVTKQNTIVDAFHPDEIKAVLFNRKDAEKVAALFNDEHEKERVDPELRKENAKLKARVAQLEEILKEHDLLPRPGRKPKTHVDPVTGEVTPVKVVSRRIVIKSRMCPGFHCDPHLFTPKSGRQTMCPECRQKMKEASRKKRVKFDPGTRVENRTGSSCPTIEEVLDMKDPEERNKWMSRWSPAEQQQANIIKNRRLRAEWDEKRRKSFRLDDPIMGVESVASSPK